VHTRETPSPRPKWSATSQRRPPASLLGQKGEELMETILLIQDDLATLVAQALILRSLGYTVLEGSSPQDVLRACHEHPGPIPLAITTVGPRNLETRHLVGQLQRLRPQTRVLVMRDAAPGELIDDGRLPGGYAVLQRPCHLRALAEAIRELLAGAQHTSLTLS
jgi:DNA-binding NtrC family response regulator